MSKHKHKKRLLLGILLLFMVNELAVQRARSIAFAAAALPVAYETAVTAAAAASAVIGAYVISQSPRDTLHFHSRALPDIHDQLQNIFPQQAPRANQSSTDPATTIEHTIINQSLKASYQSNTLSSTEEQQIIDIIRRQVVQPTIERTQHITCLPTPEYNLAAPTITAPASPIHVSCEPGKIRIDFDHLNSWISVGLNQPEQLTPIQQKLIQQQHEHAMESAITQYLWEHDPAYQNDLVSRLNATIKVFKDTNSQNSSERVAARLLLPHLRLEEPYNYTLQEVIHQLIPLFFDTEGALVNIHINDSDEYRYTIARFLKNGITPERYKLLLKKFGFLDVLEYEESFGTKVIDNINAFFEWNWLPTLNWYPYNIQDLIVNNVTNEKIQKMIAACKRHDFVTATRYVTRKNNPIMKTLYNDEYRKFCLKHCNPYGIFKEYASDPLWAELSQSAQKQLAKNIETITKLNSALKLRAVEKATIQKNWHISDDAPAHVHNALFHVVDLLGTGTHFIAKVMELTIPYKGDKLAQLQEAFFLPNGILKDFAHFDGAQNYKSTADIFSTAQRKALEQLNAGLYVHHAAAQALPMPTVTAETNQDQTLLQSIGSSAYAFAKKAIKYWSAAYAILKNVAYIGTQIFTKEKPKQKPIPVIFLSNTEKQSGGGGDKLPTCNWNRAQALNKLKQLASADTRAALGAFGISYEELENLYYMFKDTVGFLSHDGAFQRIIRNCLENPGQVCNSLRPSLYKLRTARLLCKSGEKVIEFGKKIPSGEIDLITAERAIECKSILQETMYNPSHLQSTFGKQLAYAQDTLDKPLAVFSKNPIPQEMKDWFIKQDIQFFEG